MTREGTSGDARSPGSDLLTEAEWLATFRSLGLSRRERQIARGLFADLSETVIADELGISPHTVHTHLERLYHKTGVGSRCALVVRVFAAYLDWRDDRDRELSPARPTAR